MLVSPLYYEPIVNVNNKIAIPKMRKSSPASRSRDVAICGAGLALTAALVRRWDHWLNASHHHERAFPRKDGRGVEVYGSSRPRSLRDLARGLLPCLAWLAALDLAVCRPLTRDAASRFFVLHTLANLVVSLSSLPDMLRSMRDPVAEPLGPCNVLPVYMIPSLFIYHLTVFKDVPLDEWIHHILFGAGIGGAGLFL